MEGIKTNAESKEYEASFRRDEWGNPKLMWIREASEWSQNGSNNVTRRTTVPPIISQRPRGDGWRKSSRMARPSKGIWGFPDDSQRLWTADLGLSEWAAANYSWYVYHRARPHWPNILTCGSGTTRGTTLRKKQSNDNLSKREMFAIGAWVERGKGKGKCYSRALRRTADLYADSGSQCREGSRGKRRRNGLRTT